MNKTKLILAAIGGVAVLAAAVLGWLAVGAMAENAEKRDDTQGAEEAVAKFLSSPVYPCKAGEDSVKTNASLYAAWSEAAFAKVSQFDRTIPEMTAPAFKEAMVAEARRIASSPGSAEGRFASPEFGFGPFSKYIIGKELPSHGQLARLQREWSDLVFVLDILLGAGAEQLTFVNVVGSGDPAAAAPSGGAAGTGAKNARSAKTAKSAKGKPAKKTAAAAGASNRPAPIVSRISVEVLAHPAAFVRALDAFAATNRFIVVDGFSFARASDELADNLNAGGEKKEDSKAAARKSRRGRAEARKAKAEEALLAEKRKGAVTDPESAVPLKAMLYLSVYDFGCPREAAVAAPAEPASALAAETKDAAVTSGAKAEPAKADEAKVPGPAASTNKVEEVRK